MHCKGWCVSKCVWREGVEASTEEEEEEEEKHF